MRRSSYFVDSAGGSATKSLKDFSPKRELLRVYNVDRSRNHSINDFYYDKITGKEKAVRCNCGKNHLLDKKKTNWDSNLSKNEIKVLTNAEQIKLKN